MYQQFDYSIILRYFYYKNDEYHIDLFLHIPLWIIDKFIDTDQDFKLLEEIMTDDVINNYLFSIVLAKVCDLDRDKFICKT